MSKLDKNQRVRTSKPRQTFDLSHDYLFTATTGQLRPVSHDILQPGDTVKCKFDFFLRTMPLSTAAMVDVDFMVDYFFVPMDLMWLKFGAWWSRTRSVFSSHLSGSTSYFDNPLPSLESLPWMTMDDIYSLLNSNDQKYQSLRLLDDLGLSGSWFKDNAAFNKVTSHSMGEIDSYVSPKLFPWHLFAYQAIYQHWYRNEEREAFDPNCYSTDLDGEQVLAPTNLVAMRYVNRQDDYFTASKLSPLVSNINNDPEFLHDFDLQLGQNLFSMSPTYDSVLGSNKSPLNLQNNGDVGSIPMDGDVDSRAVNQLRALFAQEKLLHVMNMTHKDYDSQVLARLGYDVPRDVKHGIQHLGHDVCQLNIQEVVSGSNTFNGETGSALGDLAGQGKAISKGFTGVKSFTAPCHGVLMTIWTCRTRPKYNASALRKDLISDISDFFTPELDDLGMQPQYLYESRLVNSYYANTLSSDPYIYADPYTITGWNYRYEYLKRNINRSSVAFMRGKDGYSFVADVPSEGNFGYNSYTQWSSSRIGLDSAFKSTSALTFDFEDDYYSRPHFDLFKVRPNELDNVMLVSWLDRPPVNEETHTEAEDWLHFPWLAFQRDPFIVDGRFSCKKVSAMSLYSMPKLV